jgi:hypothetical protein
VEEEGVCGAFTGYYNVKRDVPVTDWVNFDVGTGLILFVPCVQTGFGTHKASITHLQVVI